MQIFTRSSSRVSSRLRLSQRLLELQIGRLGHRQYASSSNKLALGEVGAPRRGKVDSWYWQTSSPTEANLLAASHFFENHPPSREWTAEQWQEAGKSKGGLIPEIIFVGRSNAGKSSIVNALTGIDINRVSSTPGATVAMSAWSLAARYYQGGAIAGWDGDITPKLTLVDMPGYGYGSRTAWSDAILSYLRERRNVRRAFMLVDALVGVTLTDKKMLDIFRAYQIPFQIVATKCDRVSTNAHSSDEPVRHPTSEVLERIRSQAELDDPSGLALGEIIATGGLDRAAPIFQIGQSKKDNSSGRMNLQWAVLQATGLEHFAMEKAEQHGLLKGMTKQETKPEVQQESKDEPNDLKLTSDFQPQDTSKPASGIIDIQEFIRHVLKTPPRPDIIKKSADERPPARKEIEARDEQYMTQSAYRARKQEEGVSHRGERSKTHMTLSSRIDQSIERFGIVFDRSAAFSRPQQHGSDDRKPKPNRLLTRASESRANDFNPATTLQQPPRPPPPPTATTTPRSHQSTMGKGVIQGFDAFDAMFASGSGSPVESLQKGKRRSKKSPASKAAASKSSREPPPPPPPKNTPPILEGKGVIRGTDAFEALLAESSADGSESSSGRRKKRRRR